MRAYDFSRLALVLSACWITAVGIFYYPKWNYGGTEAELSWDVSGYYFYLPATFIYHDLKKQKFKDSLLSKYNPASSPYQSYVYRDGSYVMKYSAGMSVMYAPFFFVANAFSKPLGYEADGFSYPYQLAIGLEGLLIAVIGLFFLRKVLRIYFSPAVTGSVLLLYVFGTNYLEYAAITNAMTHSYLFTLYSILIYLTIRFYKNPSYAKAILIGCLIGLATLTRPTEIIALFIPIGWGLHSRETIRGRLNFFAEQKLKWVCLLIFFFVIGSIQLVYWKYVTGDWLVYSYQDEKLEFFHPHLHECFIGFRKGWFVYTPLMMLIIPGFVFLYKTRKEIFWVCLMFSVVFTYLCFSWSIWWYGGGLGQRAMIQSYPMLAFPFACAIEKFLQRKIWMIIAGGVISLFVYYNLWLHHQAHKGGLLGTENMTRKYWQKVVLRYKMPEGAQKLFDTNEEFSGKQKDIKMIAMIADTVHLDSANQFSKEYEINLSPGKFKWIRATAQFSLDQKEWDMWKMTQMIVRFKSQDRVIKEKFIRLQRLLNDGESKQLFIDVKTPKQFDKAVLLFWNAGGQKAITITGIHVEAFN